MRIVLLSYLSIFPPPPCYPSVSFLQFAHSHHISPPPNLSTFCQEHVKPDIDVLFIEYSVNDPARSSDLGIRERCGNRAYSCALMLYVFRLNVPLVLLCGSCVYILKGAVF